MTNLTPASAMVLAPVEPTEAMLKAACVAIERAEVDDIQPPDPAYFWGRMWLPAASDAWSAMLAAAPPAPAGRAEVERMSDILDTERYKVAAELQGIKRAIGGWQWLAEGGRGSYTYDDERYQAEFGAALDEIDVALDPLRRIAGDWSDCPRDPLRVAANRSAALKEPSSPTVASDVPF